MRQKNCVDWTRISFILYLSLTGRSAAGLARLVRDQEVAGSNPVAPIRFYHDKIYDGKSIDYGRGDCPTGKGVGG